MTNIDPQVLWIAGAAVAALVIILAITAGMRRSRTEKLREHYGSEYDRTMRAAGSPVRPNRSWSRVQKR